MLEKVVNGLPTNPAVTKLIEKFGEIEYGQEIPYSEIEKTIGTEYGSNRWRVVTDAWRKRLLREKNWEIAPSDNTPHAFRRLLENERSLKNRKGVMSGVRKIVRGAKNMFGIKTELMTEAERREHDHANRIVSSMAHDLQKNMKEIAPPKSTPSLFGSAHQPKK